MTKKIVLAIVVLGLAALAVPAQAEDQKFTVSGELRTRWDNMNNYTDFDDDSQDLFDFWPYRARLNVSGKLANNVSVRMDVQSFGSWGNQSPILSGAGYGTSGGPIWQDFDYDGNYGGFRSSETSLYQAYVAFDKIWGSKINVTLGRQELNLGTGLILGNEEFYNGITFDGLKGVYDFEKWDLTGFYFNTNERNDPANITLFEGDGTQDQRIWGFVGSFGFGEKIKSSLDGYIVNGRDFSASSDNIHLWTYGAHWWRWAKTKAEIEEFPLDWNVELALQTGEGRTPFDPGPPPVQGTEFDTAGMIFDGSIGWSFAPGDLIHKVYVGAIMQSGDDDQTDDDAEGWLALYPSFHGRFGNADYFGANYGAFDTGITAMKIGYALIAKEGKHKAGATYWMFSPSEDSITVSPGVTNEYEDFGSEIDVWYKYMYTDNVGMSVNISQLMPDDGLTHQLLPLPSGNYADDSVTRIYGMVRVLFP